MNKKNTLKLIPAALICMLFVYTGCKKSSVTLNNKSSSALTASAVSKQIALSLYQSVTGKYGGANVGDGVKAPNNVTVTLKGPHINGVDPYCGYTIDTTLNFTHLVGDTTKSVYSHYKFIYTCSHTDLDGYVLSDSITYVDAGAAFYNKYVTAQNYVVTTSVGTPLAGALAYMNGTIGTSFHTKTIDPSTQAVVAFNNADTQFSLGTGSSNRQNVLAVQITNGVADITAGIATFSATIVNLFAGDAASTTQNYSGSIAFLGNHTAKITLTTNGNTYVNYVNLLTGELTAA